MRYILHTLVLIMISNQLMIAQDLITVADTVNHFEVGVPTGWRYGPPANHAVAFIAFSEKTIQSQDLPKENFNINIIHDQDADIDKTYAFFVQSVGKAIGFKIIEQGEKEIHGRKYKYLIESHVNPINNDVLTNYDLFTNNGGDVLILTMVTTVERFKSFKALFEAIASSLKF